jgi:hypothetical protein
MVRTALAWALLVLLLAGCVSVSESSLQSTAPQSITVDYDRSIEELVQNGGFGWSHRELTARMFPSERKGTARLRAVLVDLPSYLATEQIVEFQEKKGFRPATIRELLAFAAEDPDAQLRHPIVALGSTCSLFAPERSMTEERTFGLSMSPGTPGLRKNTLQTFWPYLSSQGSMRTLNLGQLPLMRRDSLETFRGLFVTAEQEPAGAGSPGS